MNPASLLPLVGRTVGWLRVNKPVVNLNRGYECAAWWQEETSALGVFPLVLREDYYSKGKFYATATLPATVTDCDFTSYFGGNAIGKYDKARDLGRAAQIVYRLELPKMVQDTGGHYPENLPAVEYCPVWDHVPAFIAYWKARAADWLDTANRAMAEAQETDATGKDNLFDWGSMGSYAQWAGEHALQAVEMARYLGYQTEVGDSWRKMFAKNFHWIPATA